MVSNSMVLLLQESVMVSNSMVLSCRKASWFPIPWSFPAGKRREFKPIRLAVKSRPVATSAGLNPVNHRGVLDADADVKRQISNDMLRSLYESYGNRWLYPAAFGDLPDQKVWRVLFVLAAE